MAEPLDIPPDELERYRIDAAEARRRAAGLDFQADDGAPAEPPAPPDDYEQPRAIIKATRWLWRPPETIPRREWLYGGHYIRKFLSCTIAPGGVGKSSLILAEALAMVTGRDLLGRAPDPLRVWYWNGEDPREELDRRIAAICQHFDLTADDIEDRLFVDSGRDMPVCIACQRHGDAVIATPVVNAVIRALKANRIDVMQVDPFVSSHSVTENDNAAIDRVAKQWSEIADACNASIELVHHSRKPSAGAGGETTVEDSRGASALVYRARSARVLNRMTKDEGEKAGVENHRVYFRVDNGKANLGPPSDEAAWHQLVGVDLPNGDAVGVVTAWRWPDPFDDISADDTRRAQKRISEAEWRENIQAKNWVGNAVAEVLGLDVGEKSAKASVKGMLKTWIKNGVLKVVTRKDQKRMERTFIEVGEWIRP